MILPGEWHRNAVTDALIKLAKEKKQQRHERMVASVSKRLLGSKTKEPIKEARGGTGSLRLGPLRKSNTLSVTYNSFGKKIKTVMKEAVENDQVTIHFGAHAHEPHRVTRVHQDGEVTIQPEKRRYRENRYPGGELKLSQKNLQPYSQSAVNELHDEPERLGAGMRGISGTEGSNMTEEPRKTLKVSKADWAHHTQHSTAQYDHEGKPWIVKKDPSGAAIRIPVTIEEDYPHRKTLRAIIKEAFPSKDDAKAPEEKEVSQNAKTVKGVVKKDKKDKETSNNAVSIGKEKDTFEPDPVLTPVLSIANMPGGSVR